MKKVVIILSVLLTFIFMGAFICMNQKSEERESVTAKQVSTSQFLDPMPYEIPNPMVGFPIY